MRQPWRRGASRQAPRRRRSRSTPPGRNGRSGVRHRSAPSGLRSRPWHDGPARAASLRRLPHRAAPGHGPGIPTQCVRDGRIWNVREPARVAGVETSVEVRGVSRRCGPTGSASGPYQLQEVAGGPDQRPPRTRTRPRIKNCRRHLAWPEFLGVSADLLPDGRAENDLWKRAGGERSWLPTRRDARSTRYAALEPLRQGGGAASGSRLRQKARSPLAGSCRA